MTEEKARRGIVWRQRGGGDVAVEAVVDVGGLVEEVGQAVNEVPGVENASCGGDHGFGRVGSRAVTWGKERNEGWKVEGGGRYNTFSMSVVQ